MIEAFRRAFGRDPIVLADAGGRVNLIGEHTDYHEGFVLPAAISLRTQVAAAPRDDGVLRIVSEQAGAEVLSSVRELQPPTTVGWQAYVLGPFWVLREEGFDVQGADVLIRSNVPFGGGLSSSAAVEVALVGLAAHLAGRPTESSEAARLARKAENDFCHVPCGAMDQMASACGRDNHAILLDCRTLRAELVPLPPSWAIVVADSGVKHSVAGAEYARRQQQCAEGLTSLQARHPDVRSARDLGLDVLEQERARMPEVSYRRLRHVVTENARVLSARDALAAADAARTGELLAASHASLASDYEVSCPELDVLVEVASGVSGVIGTRLTGAGWGGNTVNLVQQEAAERACAEIQERYERRTGRRTAVRVVRASRGLTVTPLE
jgi:galactokinase